RIEEVFIEEELRRSYIDYAMSVIVGRALPDAADGLKPVQRRILFAMREAGLLHNRPFKKCATVVGDVLGKYHPHGDMAVYDALVRMAQDFALRYPLIDGQGNFGSIDGDSAAAYRYTECRLTALAEEMLADLDKETVEFVPNFDGRLEEPILLPTPFPNLLANGCSGIAVGMATSIPPHNLNELIDGLTALIDNPDIDLDEMLKIIPGPDFPTGGVIMGKKGILKAYRTGKGNAITRGRVRIEELKGGKQQLVITDIPYQVNKANLITRISQLVKEKRIEGISDLRDESDKDGMRVVVELKRDTRPEVVLNRLYHYTQLQSNIPIYLLALVDNVPRVLGLLDLLKNFLEFRVEIVTRRTEYQLKKAEDRAHILAGLKVALTHIDQIIEVIKKSPDVSTAREKLMSVFNLTERQANAILEMRLSRLTGLERDKIIQELKELKKKIGELKEILSSRENILRVVREELVTVKERYGDSRQTEILEQEPEEIGLEDMIIPEDNVIIATLHCYIKRQPVSIFRRQLRGGQGRTITNLKTEDVAKVVTICDSRSDILLFTNLGRAFKIRTYEIPEAGPLSKGRAIANLIPFWESGERVTAILTDFRKDKEYIFMVTDTGRVKKVKASAFANIRSCGIRAINLNGDHLIATFESTGNDDIMLVSSSGRAVRFPETLVRPMGRDAAGVRGVRLKTGDRVVAGFKVTNQDFIITVSENGYGKRSEVSSFRKTGRGVGGVIASQINEKTGLLIGAGVVRENDEILIITKGGICIRFSADTVRKCRRNTQGVRLITLKRGDKVVDFEVIQG
ncbi:MAG TPA: DNA gyrase subunit A, partial [bacterium (Candidatus Stahlbacteria)]|nr:DNA gyrase subunit A [Candidatus Stahlbacteria bacterium]